MLRVELPGASEGGNGRCESRLSRAATTSNLMSGPARRMIPIRSEVRMKGGSNPSANIASGDHCVVVSGTHAGKSGVVRDRDPSATGHVRITVEQADGVRFKTLARNVSTQP
jgi:hypothetical protein